MPRPKPHLRLLALFVAMLLCSGVLAGRLFLLQVMDSGRMSAIASDQRLRTLTLPAHRGSILASDGSELAITLETHSVYASPREVSDPWSVAGALSPVLGVDVSVLADKLSADSGFVYLARWLEPEVAEKVQALDLRGLGVVREPKRHYPAGTLASQVIGFVGDENKGLGGLESQYDSLLTGRPGRAVLERDPSGRVIPVGVSSIEEAVQGNDLVLTLDRQIQYEAEAALARAVDRWNARGGTIVVMDPRTGDLLAMANNPNFDPNDIRSSKASDRRNRAVTDVVEPGSVSKMITAAAALEKGVVAPDEIMRVEDSLRIGDKLFTDSHPHPALNLSFAQVLQTSSNVGTIKVAERMGRETLHEYLVRFGFGSRTGLGLPGESPGILAAPERWWRTSLGTIAIGHGVAVTPLQLARSYATLANGGTAVQPNLIRATVDSSGNLHFPPSPAGERVIEQDTARALTAMLVGVTESSSGTGRAAAVPGYHVAGKTGTAQKPKSGSAGYSGYISSFVGFAPAEDPRLVVSVVLDDPVPFLSGETAAVTFQEVMEFSLRRLAVERSPGMSERSPAVTAASAGR